MKKQLVLLLLPFLLGCSNADGKKYSFKDFSYTNSEPIPQETYDFSHEDDMELDGLYKQQYGQAFFRLYHQNNEESSVYADIYGYFGENGIHTYIYVHENIINYVSQKAVYYNSSIELFINDISKSYIDNKSIQYRIAAGGKFTKLCGVRSASTWTSSYFDGSFATHVDGELNTSTCQGYGVETFVPYYELGIDNRESCQGLMFNLAMNRVPTTSQDEKLTFRQRTAKVLCFQATPCTWIPVAKTETYSGVSIFPQSEFFGRHAGIETTYGFTFEKAGNEEIGRNTKASSASYAMVKEDYNPTHYYYETRISNIDGTNSPKIGLFTMMGRNRFTLYLKSADKARAGVVQRNADNSGWDWDVGEGKTYVNDFNDKDPTIDFLSGEGAMLGIYRHNNTFGFFVNGELYFANKNLIINDIEYAPRKIIKLNHVESEVDDFYEDAHVGIYGYSARATFKQYKIYSNESADNKVLGLLGE